MKNRTAGVDKMVLKNVKYATSSMIDIILTSDLQTFSSGTSPSEF
jgi:hypothetical protein